MQSIKKISMWEVIPAIALYSMNLIKAHRAKNPLITSQTLLKYLKEQLIVFHCCVLYAEDTNVRTSEFYPGKEILILTMSSYPGCHETLFIVCIGTHAHGNQNDVIM